MPNITLSVPDELHAMMKKHTEIRWSEVARRSIQHQAERLALMDKLASKSKLTPEDVREISEKISEGMFRRFEDEMRRRHKHPGGGGGEGFHGQGSSGR